MRMGQAVGTSSNYAPDVSSLFCGQCGAKIPPDSIFCPMCGWKAAMPGDATTHLPQVSVDPLRIIDIEHGITARAQRHRRVLRRKKPG